MSRVTKDNSQFVEDIAGAFYDMFRAAGVTLTPTGHLEKVRGAAARLAASIEHRGEVKAIEVIELLQTAVTEAFKAMEKDLETRDKEVNDRLTKLEAEISNCIRDLHRFSMTGQL